VPINAQKRLFSDLAQFRHSDQERRLKCAKRLGLRQRSCRLALDVERKAVAGATALQRCLRHEDFQISEGEEWQSLPEKTQNRGSEAKKWLKTKDITFLNGANYAHFARNLTPIGPQKEQKRAQFERSNLNFRGATRDQDSDNKSARQAWELPWRLPRSEPDNLSSVVRLCRLSVHARAWPYDLGPFTRRASEAGARCRRAPMFHRAAARYQRIGVFPIPCSLRYNAHMLARLYATNDRCLVNLEWRKIPS